MYTVKLYGPGAINFNGARQFQTDNFGTATRIATILSRERDITALVYTPYTNTFYRWNNGDFRERTFRRPGPPESPRRVRLREALEENFPDGIPYEVENALAWQL